jgi:hypothetical protein
MAGWNAAFAGVFAGVSRKRGFWTMVNVWCSCGGMRGKRGGETPGFPALKNTPTS